MKGRTRQVILFVIAAVLLLALGSAVEWSQVLGAMRSGDPTYLLGAFLLTLFFPLLNMLRWRAVLAANRATLPPAKLFAITMACWPVGTLTPGKAGELLKGMAVKDRQVGLGSAIVERVIDVAVLGVFGLLGGLLVWHGLAILGGLFGLGAALGVILFGGVVAGLLKDKPLGNKLQGFIRVFPRLLKSPRLLLGCVAASGVNWFLSMLQLHWLLLAFGADSSLLLIAAILPAATFVGLIPITPAGMGTRDGALLLLAAGALDPAPLLAASIVYTLFGYFFLGACGLPFLNHLAPDRSDGRSAKP